VTTSCQRLEELGLAGVLDELCSMLLEDSPDAGGISWSSCSFPLSAAHDAKVNIATPAEPIIISNFFISYFSFPLSVYPPNSQGTRNLASSCHRGANFLLAKKLPKR
jgi:hypothetical protein